MTDTKMRILDTIHIWTDKKLNFLSHPKPKKQFVCLYGKKNYMCIWITWNKWLKVLTIVYSFWRLLKIFYFVSTKLLDLKILCWKLMEFVQSNKSLFNRKNIVEKLWTIVYYLHNIVEYWSYIVEYMTYCWKVTYIAETKLIGKKQMWKSVYAWKVYMHE